MNLTRYVLFVSLILHFSSMSFSQSRKDDNKKDKYFLLSSGILFSKSKVIDPKNFLETNYVGGFSVKATFQSQFRKRLYWEASILCNEYWIGYKLNDNNPLFLGSANDAFVSLESSYSLMYRVRTKNNKDILNLYVGLFIGYAFSSKGPTGNIGYFNIMDGQNIINELEGKVNQHSLLILGNSMGISRDFRITDKLDIGLNFNYNFGYNKLRQIDIEYTTTNSSEINTVNSTLNGTSWQSLIYFRYRISDI